MHLGKPQNKYFLVVGPLSSRWRIRALVVRTQKNNFFLRLSLLNVYAFQSADLQHASRGRYTCYLLIGTGVCPLHAQKMTVFCNTIFSYTYILQKKDFSIGKFLLSKIIKFKIFALKCLRIFLNLTFCAF